MPIDFSCKCGRMLSVADEFAGRNARCPECQSLVRVPAPEPQFEVVEQPEPPKPRAKPVKAESTDDDAYGFKKQRGRDDDDDEEDDRPRRRRKRRRSSQPQAGSGINFGFAWQMFVGLFLVILGIGGLILNIRENNWRSIARAAFLVVIGSSVLMYGFKRDD